MSLLTANNLTVSIGELTICKKTELRFAADQTWAILGRNGSGKTTLLHTLAGLREPQEGIIHLRTQPMAQLQRRFIAKQLGILFQQQDDPFPATVMETALIGRHPYIESWRGETAEDIQCAESALKSVELEGFEHRFSSTLSGGEKQRLKIATLLTQNPQIMLLDEPTNHLDLNHQIKLLNLISKVTQARQGVTLMVLHDLNLAARFCTHALLLNPGEAPLQGSLEEVLQAESLERAYGWPVKRFNINGKVFYHPQ
ncbi:MAG: ABC transporter ATP-binding protein [Pseudomonadales bacterium]|nr:ABC transporter ATP-binding protein [Pseudomonadales bacterium]